MRLRQLHVHKANGAALSLCKQADFEKYERDDEGFLGMWRRL